MKIIIKLLFILTLFDSYSNQYSYDHISIKDGLSQGFVTCIFQDSYGFLWFGTSEGLNRYNGYKIKIYKHDPDNPDSISNNKIWDICEDKNKNLWIATSRGLNCFDRNNNTFIKYFHDPNDEFSLCNDMVWNLYIDQQNELWIGTEDGLNRFNYTELNFFRYYVDKINGGHGTGINLVFSFFENKEKILLFTFYNSGVFYYDRKDDKLVNHKILNELIKVKKMRKIIQDKEDNYWLSTTNDGLYKWEKDKNIVKQYKHNSLNKKSLPSNFISNMMEDKEGILWIGTDNGLVKYDKQNDQFNNYKEINIDILSNGLIWDLYQGKQDIIWISTTNGVYKFFKRYKNFNTIRSITNNKNCLSNNYVQTIFKNKNGFLWIGTENGLNKYDDKKKKFTKYFFDSKNPNSISDNKIYTICEDHDQDLWFGAKNGVLNRYNKKSDNFIQYKGKEFKQISKWIRTLYVDSDNLLWIGTAEDGLFSYDKEKNLLTSYSPDNKDALFHVKKTKINTILEDSKKNIWIGTLEGLYIYNKITKNFYHNKSLKDINFDLIFEYILTICEDKRGNIWIGTWGGGLIKFIPSENRFINYTEKDGLANNIIYGILEDDNNFLWISTNRGLSCFNPDNKKFSNYDIHHGLPSNEFNSAYYKDRNNNLYFGSIDGYTYFNPKQINDNPFVPPLIFTSLTQGGEEIVKNKSIETIKELTLNWNNNYFEFEMSAFNFIQTNKNQYAYKLEGFDKNWNYIGYKRFGRYTNLPPGKYELKIKGSNNDDIWNENWTSIIIKITPPLWGTIWAYIFYIIIFILFVYFFIRFRMKRQEIIYNQKIKALEIEKLKEMNQQRTNFFINFAHETKTPLTIISNYLNLFLEKNKFTNELKIIKQNIDKLIFDIINLLDLEKLEKKQTFFNHDQIVNISNVLIQKKITFSKIAQKKEIKINSNIENEIFTKIDPYALDKIINNLLDNAIKYTNLKGSIYIQLISSKINNKDKIELIIKDTGIGIPKDQQKNIFEPYYQICHKKRNIQGIGMGLNIVKKIIDELEGNIEIKSELKQGTTFKIILNKYIRLKNDKVEKKIYTQFIQSPILIQDIKLRKEDYNKEFNTILIVEDNIQMLSFLQDILKPKYNVFYATNGKEALDKLKKIPIPDLIITDIMMDFMDGYTFLDELIKINKFKLIPIIFLTAKNSINEKIKGLKKGAIDFISKPFNINELKAKIDSIIKFNIALKEKNLNKIIEELHYYLGNFSDSLKIKKDENVPNINPHDALFFKYGISKRQIEIISLLKQGLERKEISDKLNISINTVKTHLSSIFEKCKVSNKTELLNIFIDKD